MGKARRLVLDAMYKEAVVLQPFAPCQRSSTGRNVTLATLPTRERRGMESAAIPAPDGEASQPVPKAGEKGLKAGALGYISNLVIGVASTAPGYSLAATLGFITA